MDKKEQRQDYYFSHQSILLILYATEHTVFSVVCYIVTQRALHDGVQKWIHVMYSRVQKWMRNVCRRLSAVHLNVWVGGP